MRKKLAFLASLVAGLGLTSTSVAGLFAAAASEKVFLEDYISVDATIDEKDQTNSKTNEFSTTDAAVKTTDWATTLPVFDESGKLVSYFGGENKSTDAKLGSAVTVESATTKMKIAKSSDGARYRYMYPVKLDGLTLHVNTAQLDDADNYLRFSFSSSYEALAHTSYGKDQGNTGIAYEFSSTAVHREQHLRGINFYSLNGFDASSMVGEVKEGQGAVYNSSVYDVDGDKEYNDGGKTFKMEFTVNEDQSVTLKLTTHRNHPHQTCPSLTCTFTPKEENGTTMTDENGYTWIGVNSYAVENNTDAYSYFSVKVEDSERTAYEAKELVEAKTALENYNVTAVENGLVTEETKESWLEKRETAVSAVSKLRESDEYLLDATAGIKAADEVYNEKMAVSLEKQILAQISAYESAPLETLDDVYAALAKKEAIGDFENFESASELAAKIAEKDRALLSVADGFVSARITASSELVESGIDGYRKMIRAYELLDSVTARDLLKNQILELPDLEEYEKTLTELKVAADAFKAKMEKEQLSFVQIGSDKNSPNDLSFVEKGLQVTFTGEGNQMNYSGKMDYEELKKGIRVVFSVDEWGYLSSIYNPNGMFFFISPKANGWREAGTVAAMFFIYESGATVQSFLGNTNIYSDLVNIKTAEAGSGSYYVLEFKINESKSRFEISADLYQADGTAIDYAVSYIAFEEAGDKVGAIDMDETTFADGVYLSMGSWMVSSEAQWNKETDPVVAENFFNTITFKVFGDKIYDDAFVIDYPKSVVLKEGTMKTQYSVGDIIDLTNATLVLTRESGATEEIAITRSMVSGFNSKKPGIITLKITYEGLSTTVDITINEKSTTPPDEDSSSSVGDTGSESGEESAKSSGCGSTLFSAGIGLLTLLGGALILGKKHRS